MATKIKKGTEVWEVLGWSRRATVVVTLLVVDSFGKKQGTAHHYKSGKMIKCHIHPDQVEKSIFPVADVEDIHSFAMKLAVEYKAENIRHCVECAQRYIDTTTPGYHESMKKYCEAVMAEAPTVIFR